MRKLLLFATMFLFSIGLYAQNDAEINRLLIHEGYNTKGYIIDRVDSLTFATVEGEVAANVNLIDFNTDTITLSITRTPECVGFKIAVEATVVIAQYSDVNLASYIDAATSDIYYQDFESAILTGVELQPGTEYSILTVGYDKYGVLCDVDRVDFETEAGEYIGNPFVLASVVEANLYDFTVAFEPNSDVSSYYVVAGAKGTLEQQYQQFAPWFGFANIGEMIMMWGLERTGRTENQWTQMEPNTEYEIFIQALDAQGNMAPHQVFELSTQALGGEGTAEVAITLGEYKLTDWDGEMLPSQFITFTPNDQTSAYRVTVALKEYYDEDPEGYKQDLCSENTMNVVGWFLFEELTTDFQIDPKTRCIALAAGKNINGEWGPITEVEFTTPESVDAKSNSGTITARNLNNGKTNQAGTIPTFKQKGQLKLTSK